jgi:hypothetical protein
MAASGAGKASGGKKADKAACREQKHREAWAKLAQEDRRKLAADSSRTRLAAGLLGAIDSGIVTDGIRERLNQVRGEGKPAYKLPDGSLSLHRHNHSVAEAWQKRYTGKKGQQGIEF